MEITQWDSIYDVYKRGLVKLIYNIASDNMPAMISDLVVWRNSPYNSDSPLILWKILFVTDELYCGTVFQFVSIILAVLSNFIQRQNLHVVPYEGK